MPSGCPLIPRSVKTSCRFRLAWLTFTRTHPSGTFGSGCSPTFRADSGSSGAACVAKTANIAWTSFRWSRDDLQRLNLVASEFEQVPKIGRAAGKIARESAGDDHFSVLPVTHGRLARVIVFGRGILLPLLD